MISVVTLTYKRHHILEEAIESFLRQNEKDAEMIIVNDAPEVKYLLDGVDGRVKIINHTERFPSILAKLKFAFSLAKNNYMFRLDDDDLLTEFSLRDAKKVITENPDFDVYRSEGHYFFSNNEYQDRGSSINNGNIYTKDYISRIEWIDQSFGEDNWLTFFHNGKIHEYPEMSMIYRWGMSTYHISGMGDVKQEEMFQRVDNDMKESGIYHLKPKFIADYYGQIREKDDKAAI